MKQDVVQNVVNIGLFSGKAKVLQTGNFSNLIE